jgi:hypothetical protein
MNTSTLKKTFALMMTLLLTIWISELGAAAQDKRGDKIEGTWQVQVTARNCQTGAVLFTVQGLTTLLRGGEALETANLTSPALRSPGHGFWRGNRRQDYTFAFMFFRFNPDGTYAGIQKVRGTIKFGNTLDETTGTSFIEVFNPAGALVASACGEQTGRRFQ